MGDGQKQQHEHKGANPNVVMGGTGTEPPRDAQTGEQVPPRPVDARTLHLTQKEWEEWKEDEAKYWEAKGDYERAHKYRGKVYNPTFGTRVKQFGAKAKDALITIAVVAVPGAILVWVGNQFLRLVSKKARERLPAWGINYMEEETTTTRRR